MALSAAYLPCISICSSDLLPCMDLCATAASFHNVDAADDHGLPPLRWIAEEPAAANVGDAAALALRPRPGPPAEFTDKKPR